MKRFALVGLTLTLLAATAATAATAQPGTVEGIEVQGLLRMSEEAFLHAFAIEVGDPYDETRVREQFKLLWEIGLFEDISVESEHGSEGGTVLIVKVKERPRLTSVSYDDNKAVTRTQIEDKLKERGFSLKLGKPLDMGAVFFAESIIRDLMAERGFLDAGVQAEVRKVTETTRAIHFKIVAGGKTKVRSIEFVGNEVFSDRKLKQSLKLTENYKFYWPWSTKNLYHPLKWDQDATNIRDLYSNAGYLDALVLPPVVAVEKSKRARKKAAARELELAKAEDQPEPAETVLVEELPEELTFNQRERQRRKMLKREEAVRKKARKAEKKLESRGKSWARLTVEIDEGEQYVLGEISFEGNELFESEFLRRLIPMNEGNILRGDALEFGIGQIQNLYSNAGHLYSSVVRSFERHPGEQVADVLVLIEEDEPYYISRIDFQGNVSTRDKVLRREVLLAEGDLFNRQLLEFSKQKINQLGYWQSPGEPVVEPVKDENNVEITFVGEEQGRNEIQIGGGYSGYDGAFFSGLYSTRNFLGRGQIVSVALQVGGRANTYQLSFQEPWFTGRPILLGASVFRREIDYGATLNSDSTGFGVTVGRRLGRFTSLNLGYNFEEVSSTTLLADATTITSDNTVSRVTPVYSFSSINNPYRPSRGYSFRLSMQIAGGPVGGDTAYLKPLLRFVGYRRLWGSNYLSVHSQLGYVTDWADGSKNVSSNIFGVPRYQRFWMGGEMLGPRVFQTRSITPWRYVVLENGQIVEVLGDPSGLPVDDVVTNGGQPVPVEVGGNRMWLLQTEFVIPLNPNMELALFVDAGDALFNDQSIDFATTRVSAGVEARFHLPIFPVPLRLIYGIPVRELDRDRTNSFTFSIGRSF